MEHNCQVKDIFCCRSQLKRAECKSCCCTMHRMNGGEVYAARSHSNAVAPIDRHMIHSSDYLEEQQAPGEAQACVTSAA